MAFYAATVFTLDMLVVVGALAVATVIRLDDDGALPEKV